MHFVIRNGQRPAKGLESLEGEFTHKIFTQENVRKYRNVFKTDLFDLMQHYHHPSKKRCNSVEKDQMTLSGSVTSVHTLTD